MAATLREGWAMPRPPVPGAVATYYLDGSECFLSWCDPETREPVLDGGIESEIAWPFGDGDFATRAELEALGFQDAEEL